MKALNLRFQTLDEVNEETARCLVARGNRYSGAERRGKPGSSAGGKQKRIIRD